MVRSLFGSCAVLVAVCHASCTVKVHPVARMAAASLSGSELVSEYVLKGVPVVLTAAVDDAVLERLATVDTFEAGAVPGWILTEVRSWPVSADGAASLGNETFRMTEHRWGCSGRGGECRVRDVWERSTPMRTDSSCLPFWSLQVLGERTWTSYRRTASESGVPVGDAYLSDEVYETTLGPGDLLVFYGGWTPYETRATGPTRSLRGVVDVADAPSRLWGPDGAFSTPGVPSPSILRACPDVGTYRGFNGVPDTYDPPPIAADGADDVVFGSGCKSFHHGSSTSVTRIDVGYMAAPVSTAQRPARAAGRGRRGRQARGADERARARRRPRTWTGTGTWTW